MNLPKLRVRLAALLLLAAMMSSCSKKPAATQAQSPIDLPPPPAQSGPDLSTPKKAALSFANTLVAGDTAGLGKIVEGTDTRMFAFYAGLSDMVASEHLFAASLKTRFGDDCVIPPEIEHIGNLPPMPSNYEELGEQINGDTATIVDASGHAGVRLKKVGGDWKVDLRTAEALLPPGGAAELDKEREQFAATKKGFNETTAKILDGAYTDCQSALDGVKAAIGAQP